MMMLQDVRKSAENVLKQMDYIIYPHPEHQRISKPSLDNWLIIQRISAKEGKPLIHIYTKRSSIDLLHLLKNKYLFLNLSQNSSLIRIEAGKSQSQKWKSTIIALVREVVSSVDPNVRKGDSLDVQPYVKLKIIQIKLIFNFQLLRLIVTSQQFLILHKI